jgi:hypothetical protein
LGISAIFCEASLQYDGTEPLRHRCEGISTWFGQPLFAPSGAKNSPGGQKKWLRTEMKYWPCAGHSDEGGPATQTLLPLKSDRTATGSNSTTAQKHQANFMVKDCNISRASPILKIAAPPNSARPIPARRGLRSLTQLQEHSFGRCSVVAPEMHSGDCCNYS